MTRLQTVTGVTREQLDSSRYDAVPQPDGTFTLVPVLWWDDNSYADYQGDSCDEDV